MAKVIAENFIENMSVFIFFVFVAKIVIESLVLSLPEVLGAFFGLVIWFIVGKNQRSSAIVTTMVLATAITIERLAPFQFEEIGRTFGWLPFRSFLGGSIAVNTMAFLEKFFLYGSMIWCLALSGIRLSFAVMSVAVMLFFTSLAETHLPDRSAEVTDAVMALIIGSAMAVLRTGTDETMTTKRLV